MPAGKLIYRSASDRFRADAIRPEAAYECADEARIDRPVCGALRALQRLTGNRRST